MPPTLVKASLQAPAELDAFLRDMGGGEHGFTGEPDLVEGRITLDAYLRRLVDMAEGRNLASGWVPMTTLWLLDEAGAVAGASRLRHSLTEGLLTRGGHIGYYVAPAQRGKGYGTSILQQTLPYAQELGIDRVLLTVDSDNEPSVRVIEGNGGVLEDERPDSETGLPYRRYWITL